MDLRLDSSNGRDDPHAVSDFNCFASLILYGKHIKAIHERCESLADQFAARHTRVRDRVGIYPCDSTDEDKKTQSESLGLSGRVVMGSSRVLLEGKPSDAYVIRFAAKTNEDMYRVFHDVLRPLAPSFGLEFYKERIRAQRSEILRKDPAQPKVDGMTIQTPNRIRKPPLEEFFPLFPPTVARNSTSDANFWSIAMLADSSLPTGSFAHSAGLEAAGQLGMIKGEKDVLTFVQAATRSSMQLLTPFLISGHRISQGGPLFELSKIQEKWNKLNQQAQAVMVTNEPACAASLDQGKSLARIASQWLRTESNLTSQYQNSQMVEKILECLKSNPPHIAPALGVIGGIMGLDEIQVCRLFAYCMARDLVSAAVRLSLVGPLASVPLLHKVRESAEDGMRVVLLSMKEHPDDPLMSAAASAPVIEALHPCHEILQVRLFRS
jgi:urease accessory protein